MPSITSLRNPTLAGIGALLMIVLLALSITILYVRPPGRVMMSFYTDDVASVHPGDSVRIAGITVGRVKELSIEPGQVKVRSIVDEDAFIGDQSQIQVRMLTVVGGYYINLSSLGDKPLGNAAIPLERVTMPYSLVRTLTDATDITERVAAKPLRESLDQLEGGLTGTNVDSFSAVIDAGNSLTAAMDQQRGQISTILNLSDEYIEALSDFGDELKHIVLKISILEQTLMLYGKGFSSALKGMGDVVDAIQPLAGFYMNHRDEFLEKVRNWQDIVRAWADRSGTVVGGLRRVRNKIERVLDAQNAGPELLATDLCIPLPGSPC